MDHKAAQCIDLYELPKNLEYTFTVDCARLAVRGLLTLLQFYNWSNIPFEDKQGQGSHQLM